MRFQRRRTDAISDERMFAEMDRIWRLLGHRPSRHEWEAASPTVSYPTYGRRFGGWVAACRAFLDSRPGSLPGVTLVVKPPAPPRTRDVPLRLRLRVLERDRFRCLSCGKSPATCLGVILHVDHKVPFAKGGKTELENLQTLCGDCNSGKGAVEIAIPAAMARQT